MTLTTSLDVLSYSPVEEVQKDQDPCPLVIIRADVCKSFKSINPHSAPGPDGIPGRALRVCAVQLAGVFTDIFNTSLLQSVVPTCLQKSTIVPIPKKSKTSCFNDYRSAALTSIIMKCFERLVKSFITSSLADSLDPLQFAYRANRSTEDAIALILISSRDAHSFWTCSMKYSNLEHSSPGALDEEYVGSFALVSS